MRFAELALMSLPVLLLVAWFAGLRHTSQRVLMACALLLGGIGAGLLWFGAQRAVRGPYVPARLQGDQIVPGRTP